MNRDQFLADRLRRFLTERRVPPRSLATPSAQMDEMKALNRIVTARAPAEGFEEWWDEVEMFIGSHATTRAWPTEKEMLEATQAARSNLPAVAGRSEWKLDPLAVAARRIKAGESVGEDWLYGRLAVDLLSGGYVSENDLRPARVALYHAMKDTWGEEEADAAVAERQRKHEAAKAVARGDVAYFTRGDGDGVIRPRMMPGMTPLPDYRADEAPAPTVEEIAARPYTDAERARMARLRPPQPPHEAQA